MLSLKNLNKKQIVIFVLVFVFLFKLFIALSFKNSDWEPDSFLHFLELRTVFAVFPNNLSLGLGVWTKPLYAYPLGLLVQIFNIKDLFAVEVINILISILISFLVYKIVLKLFGNFKIAILSIILTSFSLTLFKSSVSTLTDQIFCLMLILSAYFASEKKYKLASLFIGLSVVGRIEGLFFVGVYNLWLIYELGRSQYKKILINWVITLIPVFIWNLFGAINSGLPFFVIQGGYTAPVGSYGYGSILSYPKMFALQEFVLSILFIVGSFYLWKVRKEWKNYKFLILLWLSFVGFLLVEALLWKLGIFGSAGLMRYFVGCLPFMLIVGAFGSFKLFQKLKQNQQIIFIFVILLLNASLLMMNLSGVVFKKQFPEENLEFKQAGEWIKNNISTEENLYADRPEVIYYSGRNLTNAKYSFSEQYYDRKPGIYVWTKDWGPSVFQISAQDLKSENILYKVGESVYILKIN